MLLCSHVGMAVEHFTLDFHVAVSGCFFFSAAAAAAFGARWGLGAPVGAGLAHTAAVANSVEEAAVACVTGVTARQLVAQAGLLVRDTAARGAHVPALELQGLGHLLGGILQCTRCKQNIIIIYCKQFFQHLHVV